MKIVCSPLELPTKADAQYLLFGRPEGDSPNLGIAGARVASDIQRLKLTPPQRAWDLLSIAISIVAADESCIRSSSPDGWTREIELDVAVSEPDFWTTLESPLNDLLSFLTGDLWSITFSGGGFLPKKKERTSTPFDSACLLSGGLDSLCGGLQMASEGRTPIFASQVAAGDKLTQRHFAQKIAPAGELLQLNHSIKHRDQSERSQRSRSILFLSYGVLAASSLDLHHEGSGVDLWVPENGFISLNVPLTPLRIGSLSTRTTHPRVLAMFQKLLTLAGLRINVTNPFQLKTKGEVLLECQNQKLLKQLVFSSTSCSRFSRNGFMHCGRCVPCLVRRAAFKKWKVADKTVKGYKHTELSFDSGDDVRAVGAAIFRANRDGVERWISGALNSREDGSLEDYKSLLRRGLKELEEFLIQHKAL